MEFSRAKVNSPHVATHDPAVVAAADHVLQIKDGVILDVPA